MTSARPSGRTLGAAVQALVPADQWPDGWQGGVSTLYDHEGPPSDVAAAVAALSARGFVEMGPEARDAELSRLDAPHLEALLRFAYAGFYGGMPDRLAPAWSMTGFNPLGSASSALEVDRLQTVTVTSLRAGYDVVVVGAGAGGGITAMVLAEAGARVLLVERARQHSDSELRGDHVHGKRVLLDDPTAGPGPGHPRVFGNPGGPTRVVDPVQDPWGWGLNAMTVGGGTRLWQGISLRFMPEDFEMADRYGVPEGSSLANWPISYDDLEPYYDKVEWEIGVSGSSEGPLTERTRRRRAYPMPPIVNERRQHVFGGAADRLGWRWGPVPFAINSVPRAGRAACVRCPQCVGHTSPVNAKNGTHNTAIPRALATGNCDLLVSAHVLRINHAHGAAASVRLVVDTADGPLEREIGCGRVVVSSGAIETPRLLLVSGIGSRQVGANLHSHALVLKYGLGDTPLPAYEGPGHSVATLDFVHGADSVWGGGVLLDAPAPLPLLAAQLAAQLGAPRWGAGHKSWMRDRLDHLYGAIAIGQDVPSAQARVSADTTVRDRYGMPVAKLTTDVHPATVAVRDYLSTHLDQWLAELGLREPLDVFAALPAANPGEHSAGTCRMGEDPETSACDRDGRVHGTANIFVADASLLPTNGSVNPCETTMANAWRVAEGMVDA